MKRLLKTSLKLTNYIFKRYCTSDSSQNVGIERIRNIGILAHIDAGKTTATERMLYYTGSIKHMGEVHHGNTITDYMSQERERGITITSAAVSLYWKNHQFNLIDTPGHIDFTMEVEQTLSVLDGVIIILDSSAGVEAQTITVWRQTDRYNLPRIIFLNKMDRLDANIDLCLKSVENKLEIIPLCLQLPIKDNGKLVGIIDILSLEKIIYKPDQTFIRSSLTEKEDQLIWEKAKTARNKVVDVLSEYNDDFANLVITSDSMETVPTTDIVRAIKKSMAEQKVSPILIGSAYKNLGMQPLMDSVIMYLPSPVESDHHFNIFEENLCARAFKVIHHKQKGALVFFRIYNGEIKKGQKIYSITQNKTEQTTRLYVAFADDFQEVDSVKNGNIAVVTGLKVTRMGDLVTNNSTAAQRAKQKLLKLKEAGKITISDSGVEKWFSVEANIPEPVFFCSIEPQSGAYQLSLDNALIELQREDPSLTVTHNHDTGQTVLGGMGELHLEIIRDRILKDYKVNADLGPLQIAYQEALITKVTDRLEFSTKIGNAEQSLTIEMTLFPFAKPGAKETMVLDKTQEAAKSLAHVYYKHLLAIRHGIDVALNHGPRLSCKVLNAQVMLHYVNVSRGTSETMITAATTQLIQKLMKESGSNILEPIMHLEIVTPPESLSSIMADLSRRRAIIQDVSVRGKAKVLIAETPLVELLGYSTILRTISSGTATFVMEFSDYRGMSSVDEENAIRSIRGF